MTDIEMVEVNSEKQRNKSTKEVENEKENQGDIEKVED